MYGRRLSKRIRIPRRDGRPGDREREHPFRIRSGAEGGLSRAIRRLLLKEEGSVIMTTAFYDPPTERRNKEYIGNISATYGFGAHVAEVEVDPDTGEVTLLGLWAAHDVGRAINPMTVEGPG